MPIFLSFQNKNLSAKLKHFEFLIILNMLELSTISVAEDYEAIKKFFQEATYSELYGQQKKLMKLLTPVFAKIKHLSPYSLHHKSISETMKILK